jgi:hypothetical protein
MRRSIAQMMTAADLAGSLSFSASALAQAASTPSENATPEPDNAVTLAIFLKHDETVPIAGLTARLEMQGFCKAFPPAGVDAYYAEIQSEPSTETRPRRRGSSTHGLRWLCPSQSDSATARATSRFDFPEYDGRYHPSRKFSADILPLRPATSS